MRILPRLTGLWRNADFVKLWIGSTTSQFGSLLGALNFTAVIALDATPFQMGVLSAVAVAPGLLFGFVAGVWVDRMRRRPILIATDLGRAVSLASIPVAFFLGVLYIEHLYIVAFFNGAMKTFFDVSFGAYVPSLVSRDRLIEANSKLAASESVVETSAFSIGGWIVQLLNSIVVVVIDAITFLISAIFLLSIRKPEALTESTTENQSTFREALDGLKFVLGNPILRALTGSAVAEGLQHGIIGSIILIYGVRELGFDTGVLATIWAVGGLSALAGAAYATRITRRFGLGPSLIAGFLIFGIGAFILPVARGPLLVAGAVLVLGQLFDAAYTLYGINEISIRQAVTPNRLLGRVNASIRFVGIASFLIGSLLGGALAEEIGLRWTLVIGAITGTSGGLWLLLSPVRRLRETPAQEGDVGDENV